MSFLKNIGKIFSTRTAEPGRAIYLYVRCNKCGEKLRARVDTYNELTPDYNGNSDQPSSYFSRKVLIGEKLCYQPIELRLKFDRNHKLVNQEISGGKFIGEEEFLKVG
jgi:hypothetical protein